MKRRSFLAGVTAAIASLALPKPAIAALARPEDPNEPEWDVMITPVAVYWLRCKVQTAHYRFQGAIEAFHEARQG